MLQFIHRTLALTLLFSSTMILANEQASVADSAQDAEHVETSEDRFSFEALKRIHLNQLKIDARANQDESVKDPFQPLNRKFYNFNMKLDQYALRPIAVQYKEKIPEDVRGSYGNFRSNLREPLNAINQLLQGRPKIAAKSLGRFTLNSLTSLGFADVAKRRNLNNERDTFAITLGVWGVHSGPYIMLPFMGPSTLRDASAGLVDTLVAPQNYLFDQDRIYWLDSGLGAIHTRSQLLSIDDVVKGDQYAILRDAYLQQQAFIIASKRGEDTSESMFLEDSSTDNLDDGHDDELDNF